MIVGATVVIAVHRLAGLSDMPVRHEELRVVERRAPIEDALVSERFQERDDRVDFLGVRDGAPSGSMGVPSIA